jgi:hypothetical protein
LEMQRSNPFSAAPKPSSQGGMVFSSTTLSNSSQMACTSDQDTGTGEGLCTRMCTRVCDMFSHCFVCCCNRHNVSLSKTKYTALTTIEEQI